MTRKRPEELRSHRWFGVNDLRAFGHRSRLRQLGYDSPDWNGKPVIGIINTWSDINACHGHLRARAEDVKRGILQAGGLPIELPAMSLAEPMVKPSTMLYRNFLAMETEELMRSHPIDGAVLMGGCDKTTPGLVMGAISMGLPAIYVPAGPSLRGNWRGETLGSGSDAWKYWDEKRAGRITEKDWAEIEGGISRSFGTCMVMGTAATMMAIAEALGLALPGASSIPAAEALGLALPGASSIPAVDSSHIRMCAAAGRRIVDMVWEDLTPARILTPASFDNAIRVHMAMGGSTNAIIHLVAMARRAGIALDMKRFDDISREVPVLANVRPSGKYLMEDFYYAGGIRGLMAELRERLDLACLTVTGKPLADSLDGAKVHLRDIIHSLNDPISTAGATAVLTGNLAPRGCVMKPSAADPRLLKHRGPALAFEDYNHMAREIDRDDLAVTPDHVIVLKNAGPKGGPPASCMWRRKATWADRLLSLRPAMRSRSTPMRGASISTSPTKNWRAAAAPGARRRRITSAVTGRCIRPISGRPMRAAILIFCLRGREPRSRRFIEAVMPALVAGIHVFLAAPQQARRRWPGRARP